MESGVKSLLLGTGCITTVITVHSSLKFIWNHFLKPYPNLRKMYSDHEEGKETYAIITGGSAGIGLEIAKILVIKTDLNIVLIARNHENLEKAANELRLLNPKVKVRIISADASSSSDYSIIIKQLVELDISLLVNNVGVHNDIPCYAEDMDYKDYHRIISVNCLFHVIFTSHMIPILKRSSNKTASIVNISSLTSNMAMPLLSAYAATKAFEDHWSIGLAAELEPTKINITCLRPGLTTTHMSGITTPTLIAPSASVMAYSCVKWFGSGKLSFAPYWPHAILDIINDWIPTKFGWSIVRKMHEEKRNELLSKLK